MAYILLQTLKNAPLPLMSTAEVALHETLYQVRYFKKKL